MQYQGPDFQGDRGHLDEDAKISSGQTLHQGTPSLSQLLSPPLTSPLIHMGTIDPTPPLTPLHQYSPPQSLGPRFTSTNAPHPVYDPNRGVQLRSAADRANPYRDRLEQVENARGQERARSRSPRRSIQPADFSESRELPQGPFMGFNHYAREMYVPPGINDLMPQNMPSSSPTLSPNNTQRSHGRVPAMDHSWDSPGQSYLLMDDNLYEYHHDQQHQVQECDPGHPTQQANNQEEDTNDNNEDHLCEFAAPCRMHPSPDGMHYRKVVSHVFGRNKAVTKLFPLGVWVHYCRKHYQRARYRADQWPFTQTGMEWRVSNSSSAAESKCVSGVKPKAKPSPTPPNQNETTPSAGQAHDQNHKSLDVVTRSPGRKHPTAIIAPVPDWLRQHVGHGKTFQEIRQIIELVRSHMVRLRNLERAKQQLSHIPKSPAAPGSPHRGALSNRRKGRIPRPANRTSTIRFPDVEILPHFKPWVKEAAIRQRSATSCPTNEGDSNSYESEKRIHGGGHNVGEISDTCVTNAQAKSNEPTNGNFPTDDTTPGCDGTFDHVYTTERTANISHAQAHIGRAGTNRGQSESQRRRSERVYIKAIDRTPSQRSIKKPGKDGEK
ncbi:hypothetical protein N7445_009588 [Penicillium cf. griseofulvum]|nr:hypothetical protein N7445_009588 [Penicillium cf. griseofulvum]